MYSGFLILNRVNTSEIKEYICLFPWNSMAVLLPHSFLENPLSFSSLYLSVAKIVTEVEYFKDYGPNCYQIVTEAAFCPLSAFKLLTLPVM